jgi:predicted nucleic acid-binding protein
MTGRCVLDASAAVRMVNRDATVGGVLARLEAASLVIAPRLFASEVASALWKYVRAGALSSADAGSRLQDALMLVDSFDSDESLAAEALAEAVRCGHPPYDLVYLVLARRHGACLLTADAKAAALAAELGLDACTP